MKSVARRQREELDHGRRLAASPDVVGDRRFTDSDAKATQQLDSQRGRDHDASS
jgi:hypothetical protein